LTRLATLAVVLGALLGAPPSLSAQDAGAPRRWPTPDSRLNVTTCERIPVVQTKYCMPRWYQHAEVAGAAVTLTRASAIAFNTGPVTSAFIGWGLSQLPHAVCYSLQTRDCRGYTHDIPAEAAVASLPLQLALAKKLTGHRWPGLVTYAVTYRYAYRWMSP
jgi:hypothetical protein